MQNNQNLMQQNSDVLLLDGERIDDLQYNGLKIIQNASQYCFSSDAVLLCNFANVSLSTFMLASSLEIFSYVFTICS